MASCSISSILEAAAAARSLALFYEPPRSGSWRVAPLPAGWVLAEDRPWAVGDGEEDGKDSTAPIIRLLRSDGSSSLDPRASAGRTRELDASAPRRLLRVTAAESTTPGLNWALGLDAVRVLESADASGLDWLLSVEADELDDIIERIRCGVRGSQLQRRMEGALRVQVLPTRRCALVLPEACRAAAVAGALPRGVEPLWRISPTVRAARGLERMVAVAPFWVSAASAPAAALLARALPHGATWVAHVTRAGAAPLSAADVEALRLAGCAGLAVAGPACLAAEARPVGAPARTAPAATRFA